MFELKTEFRRIPGSDYSSPYKKAISSVKKELFCSKTDLLYFPARWNDIVAQNPDQNVMA